jgi:isopropylmalate/homocitrate/citramalate synthase
MDKVIDQAMPANVKVIQAGDTLTSIVRDQAQQQGVKLTPSEEFRWTQALAADSGIKNPNAIFPGQKVQLQNMLAQRQAGQTQPNTPNHLANNLASNSTPSNNTAANPSSTAVVVANPKATAAVGLPKGNYINAVAHPCLAKP